MKQNMRILKERETHALATSVHDDLIGYECLMAINPKHRQALSNIEKSKRALHSLIRDIPDNKLVGNHTDDDTIIAYLAMNLHKIKRRKEHSTRG